MYIPHLTVQTVDIYKCVHPHPIEVSTCIPLHKCLLILTICFSPSYEIFPDYQLVNRIYQTDSNLTTVFTIVHIWVYIYIHVYTHDVCTIVCYQILLYQIILKQSLHSSYPIHTGTK